MSDPPSITVRPQREPRLFLQQAWLDGTLEGVEFTVTCGAGVGNPMIIVNCGELRESLNVTELLNPWISRMAREQD